MRHLLVGHSALRRYVWETPPSEPTRRRRARPGWPTTCAEPCGREGRLLVSQATHARRPANRPVARRGARSFEEVAGLAHRGRGGGPGKHRYLAARAVQGYGRGGPARPDRARPPSGLPVVVQGWATVPGRASEGRPDPLPRQLPRARRRHLFHAFARALHASSTGARHVTLGRRLSTGANLGGLPPPERVARLTAAELSGAAPRGPRPSQHRGSKGSTLHPRARSAVSLTARSPTRARSKVSPRSPRARVHPSDVMLSSPRGRPRRPSSSGTSESPAGAGANAEAQRNPAHDRRPGDGGAARPTGTTARSVATYYLPHLAGSSEVSSSSRRVFAGSRHAARHGTGLKGRGLIARGLPCDLMLSIPARITLARSSSCAICPAARSVAGLPKASSA